MCYITQSPTRSIEVSGECQLPPLPAAKSCLSLLSAALGTCSSRQSCPLPSHRAQSTPPPPDQDSESEASLGGSLWVLGWDRTPSLFEAGRMRLLRILFPRISWLKVQRTGLQPFQVARLLRQSDWHLRRSSAHFPARGSDRCQHGEFI